MRGDEAAYLRGLMTPAGATAAAVAGAGFLATRPGWRILTMACEAFDSTGDKVLEFESAVLVKTG